MLKRGIGAFEAALLVEQHTGSIQGMIKWKEVVGVLVVEEKRVGIVQRRLKSRKKTTQKEKKPKELVYELSGCLEAKTIC